MANSRSQSSQPPQTDRDPCLSLTDEPLGRPQPLGRPPRVTTSVYALLADTTRAAFSAYLGEELHGFDPQIRQSGTHQNADYQANGLIGESRRRGLNPVEVANALAHHISGNPAIENVEASGPGFLNFTISNSFLVASLKSQRIDDRCGTTPVGNNRRVYGRYGDDRHGVVQDERHVVVDYSSPNVAKEMHVGHLRSTIIGDALVRMFEFDGAKVLRQNHIGDWGTPFGMLIEYLVVSGISAESTQLQPGELGTLYRNARAKFEDNSDFRERSRRRVVLLQSGDSESIKLWGTLCEASYAYFRGVYKNLGVLLEDEDIKAESAYQSKLPEVVEELVEKTLLREDKGALCAFPEGFTSRDGSPLPLIVRKADGGFGYAATDLAAIRYRTIELNATHLVYVVGSPQALHFSMLFAVAQDAGWLDGVEVSHVAFGSVLGMDGKMLKSREGEVALLDELIESAVHQVSDMTTDRDEIGDDEIERIALSALKYADLSNDRLHDYTFNPERMVRSDGNTGPYLLYAYTRIAAVFRRADRHIHERFEGDLQIEQPSERQLALTLLEFDHQFKIALNQLSPQVLCAYAYSLARAFTRFYEECPILNESSVTTVESRLEMCQLAAKRLRLVLSLLGIETVDRM